MTKFTSKHRSSGLSTFTRRHPPVQLKTGPSLPGHHWPLSQGRRGSVRLIKKNRHDARAQQYLDRSTVRRTLNNSLANRLASVYSDSATNHLARPRLETSNWKFVYSCPSFKDKNIGDKTIFHEYVCWSKLRVAVHFIDLRRQSKKWKICIDYRYSINDSGDLCY